MRSLVSVRVRRPEAFDPHAAAKFALAGEARRQRCRVDRTQAALSTIQSDIAALRSCQRGPAWPSRNSRAAEGVKPVRKAPSAGHEDHRRDRAPNLAYAAPGRACVADRNLRDGIVDLGKLPIAEADCKTRGLTS